MSECKCEKGFEIKQSIKSDFNASTVQICEGEKRKKLF